MPSPTHASYYKRFFPSEEIATFLGRTDSLKYREFAFNFETRSGEEAMSRWRSVDSASGVKELVTKGSITKIHAGAVYNARPSAKASTDANFATTGRELVFDIDLNDYPFAGVDKDDIGSCDAAWPLAGIGARIMHFLLFEAFGFEHILVVYSGRRGCHVYVCDERAFQLDDYARAATVRFLQPSFKTDATGRLHCGQLLSQPLLFQAFKSYCIPLFEEWCIVSKVDDGLGVFDSLEQKLKGIAMLDCKAIRPELTRFAKTCTGAEFWTEVKRHVRELARVKRFKWLESNYHELIMTHTWPRLDSEVTKRRQHLLKLPFSVHPKTDRLAVPISTLRYEQFLPDTAPTAAKLCLKDTEACEAFNSSLEKLRSFTTHLDATKEKQLQALPDVSSGPPCKRQSFDLRCGSASSDTSGEILADRDRVCWIVIRNIHMEADAHGIVRVYQTHSASCKPSKLVKAGEFPPFSKDSRDHVQEMLECVTACETNPESAWHATSREQIVMVRDATVEDANDHFEKLRDGLLTPYKIMDVNVFWGHDAIASAFRTALLPRLCMSSYENTFATPGLARETVKVPLKTAPECPQPCAACGFGDDAGAIQVTSCRCEKPFHVDFCAKSIIGRPWRANLGDKQVACHACKTCRSGN